MHRCELDGIINEECGIAALCGSVQKPFADEGSRAVKLGIETIYALQHRGQSGAGMAVSDGTTTRYHKGSGLIRHVLCANQFGADLNPVVSIYHTRYGTFGNNEYNNLHPHVLVDTRFGTIAVVHNGTLTNSKELRMELSNKGVGFFSNGDTEVIPNLIMRSECADLKSAIIDAVNRLEGAFCLLIMVNDRVFAIRDNHGVRPLAYSQGNLLGYGKVTVVASETCALQAIGFTQWQDVTPGHMLTISADGIESDEAILPQAHHLHCSFCWQYFSKPESELDGSSVYLARKSAGYLLANQGLKTGIYPEVELANGQPDDLIVIPIPDSAWPATLGYCKALGVTPDMALSRDVWCTVRSFLESRGRSEAAGAKVRAILAMLREKRVVFIDDSIVRGTTTQKLVQLMHEALATEIHARIVMPPVRWPCYYGIDMATEAELIAARCGGDVEAIRHEISPHLDTLAYLSLESHLVACGSKLGPDCTRCHACFSGFRNGLQIPTGAVR
jgi:amidophosphoribosyltransferase